MKFTTIVAVLALFGVVSVNAIQIKNKVGAAQTEKQFANYISKFSRSYRSNEEYQARLSNFAKNLDIVNNHNSNNLDYQLELNKFADLSDKEYKSMLGFRSDLI
jgi:C1A family cysteine protease